MTNYKEYFIIENCEFRLDDSQVTLEWLAVLSAKDIGYKVSHEDEFWVIGVDPEQYDFAVREVSEYEDERGFFDELKRKSKEQVIQIQLQRSNISILIGFLLLIFFYISGPDELASSWNKAGVLNSMMVMDGQWWRCITALTLHKDLPHVLGNTVFLIIFASALCHISGFGFAWLCILLAGIIGNILTVLFYNHYVFFNHCALGASTAVFAALGILGAYRCCEKLSEKNLHYTNVIPLFAAIALLAITGVAQGSDVVAHVMGFISGATTGLILFFSKSRTLNKKLPLQVSCLVLAAGILVIAWLKAFS